MPSIEARHLYVTRRLASITASPSIHAYSSGQTHERHQQRHSAGHVAALRQSNAIVDRRGFFRALDQGKTQMVKMCMPPPILDVVVSLYYKAVDTTNPTEFYARVLL